MFAATRFFINHPRLVILLCVATVISASIFALRVERDNSLGNMIPDDNPVIVYYNDEFSKYFDLRSKVVVGLFSDESIYRPDTLAKLERVTRALEKDSRLVNVTSLATAEDITVDDGLMNIEPIMADVPGTGAEAEALRARVNDNVFIRDGLVSDDERATLIVAMPVFEVSETEKSIQLYDDVLALLESEQGPERLVFSGFPVAVGLINKYMTRDIKVMLPIVALVMILTLYASFRTIRGVLIPMAVVGFSVVCTFGFMGAIGAKMTIIGTSIPVVLIAVGVADGIHVLSEFYWQLRRGLSKREAVELTMKEMNTPVILTSVTTFVGFMALAVSEIIPIREYGLLVGYGVVVAMVFSLAFIPAILMLLPEPRKLGPHRDDAETKLLDRFSNGLGNLSVKRTKPLLVVFAVLLVIGVILTAQTRVEHDTLAEFRKSSPIRQADNLLNAHFGGTSQTNVVIDAGEDGGIQDPALLAKIEGLRKHVLELPEVGFTESVVDYIKRMNYAMHEQDPAYRRLPRETEEAVTDEGERVPVAGRDLIAQYLVLYEMGGGEELERIVDAGRRRANIFVNVRSYSSAVLGRVLRHVKEYVAENFAPPVRVNYSGTGAVQLELVKALVTGQIRSLLLSITVVFLCVVLIFRSFTYGLLGILPLGMTILLNFSIMVLSGIPLNVGTALIASISIGTGVDYAIHFLHRYRIEAGRGGGDHAETVHRTMRTAGRAIMLNALAVGLGFLILVFSSFIPIVDVGILMPVMMLSASTGSLIVIPTLMNLSRPTKPLDR